MDFDDAVKAHSDRKLKLASYLRSRDGSLDPAVVCKDNAFELGKWIYGEGAHGFAGLGSFQGLKCEHARFHHAAAGVVQKANGGQDVSEETTLGAKSDFAIASRAVVASIIKVKGDIAKKVAA